MWIVFFQTVGTVILAISQLSFVQALPAPLYHFNTIIIVLVLLLFFYRLKKTLIFVLIAGFIFDIHTHTFFGLHMLSLLASAIISYLFLEKFFTNKSLYSFIFIAGIATLFYESAKVILLIIFNSLIGGAAANFSLNQKYFNALVAELLLNILAATIIFYGINYFSKKLKPFLIR